MTSIPRIAIIGAGLSGLGMALALSAHSIPCTVYEQSSSKGRFAGALMLSPNSLRILDTYGIYSKIHDQGYNIDVGEIKDAAGNLKDRGFYLGSQQLFGYDALRIYRNALLKELVQACLDRGIEIIYDKKFAMIVSDNGGGVDIGFQDGSTAHVDVLVAADGIYSKIRTSLFPGIVPEYNGVLVVGGAVKAASLRSEGNNTGTIERDGVDAALKTFSLIEGKNGVGAFLLGPQLADASELLAATQRPFPAQAREEWTRLAGDREFHHKFLREGYHDRLPIVQRSVDNIVEDSTYIWPLQTVPKLPRWWSEETGRVVLIGDAAHAMPPTGGQGANQAFEDGWTLARALRGFFDHPQSEQYGDEINGSAISDSPSLTETMSRWHARRQERINQILKLTQQMHNLRLPLEEQRNLKDGEVWKSLVPVREGSSITLNPEEEEEFKRAIFEQWSWLYCPEDLVQQLAEGLRPRSEEWASD